MIISTKFKVLSTILTIAFLITSFSVPVVSADDEEEDEEDSSQAKATEFTYKSTGNKTGRYDTFAGGSACCGCGVDHYGILPYDFPKCDIISVTFYAGVSRANSYYTTIAIGPTALKLVFTDPVSKQSYSSIATSVKVTDEKLPVDVQWYVTFEFEPAVHLRPGIEWALVDGDNNIYSALYGLHSGDIDPEGLPGTSETYNCQYARVITPVWYTATFRSDKPIEGPLPKPGPRPQPQQINVGTTVFNYYDNEIKKYINLEGLDSDGNIDENLKETYTVGVYEIDNDITNWRSQNYDYDPDGGGLGEVAGPELFNATYYSSPVNIAKGGTLYESGHKDGREAARAVDGLPDKGEGWASPKAESTSSPSMFAISFEEEHNIEEIIIYGKEEKRRPSNFKVQLSKYDYDSTDWLSTDVVWHKSYTTNTQERLVISIDPAVKAKCVRITIYSTYGLDEGKCEGLFKNKNDCAAALDEVQVFEVQPNNIKYMGVDYIPITVYDSNGTDVVGHLIADSSGNIVRDYDTLWAVFDYILTFEGAYPSTLVKISQKFEQLAEERQEAADEARAISEEALACSVMLDFVAAYFSVASGVDFWSGLSAALNLLNTPLVLAQLWEISNEEVSLPRWRDKYGVKSAVDAMSLLCDMREAFKILVEVKTLTETTKRMTDTSHMITAFFLSSDSYTISKQLLQTLKKQQYSIATSLMKAFKQEVAVDALQANLMFSESAIVYMKLAQVTKAARDGIYDVNELEDIAYIGLMSAHAAKRDQTLLQYLIDTYNEYLSIGMKGDWRAWAYRCANPVTKRLGITPGIDEVRNAAQTGISGLEQSTTRFVEGFYFDMLLACADSLWAEDRLTEYGSDEEELARQVESMREELGE